MDCNVLRFNDMSTLDFVSSSREREKRDRRDSRDERGGQGRKRILIVLGFNNTSCGSFCLPERIELEEIVETKEGLGRKRNRNES